MILVANLGFFVFSCNGVAIARGYIVILPAIKQVLLECLNFFVHHHNLHQWALPPGSWLAVRWQIKHLSVKCD